jgi:hypothetical protein
MREGQVAGYSAFLMVPPHPETPVNSNSAQPRKRKGLRFKKNNHREYSLKQPIIAVIVPPNGYIT